MVMHLLREASTAASPFFFYGNHTLGYTQNMQGFGGPYRTELLALYLRAKGSKMYESVTPKLLIRIPADVRQWLEREAARNLSSMTSEVVRALRCRMENEPQRAVG